MSGKVAIFSAKTKEKTIKEKKVEIAKLEKKLEILWRFEENNSYIFGNQPKIIAAEIKLAGLKRELELDEN